MESKSGSDMTPLLLAVGQGHLSVVDLLINRGANLEYKSCTGMTALLLAIHNQNHAIASLLLSRGADPDVNNPENSEAFLSIRKAEEYLSTAESLEKFSAAYRPFLEYMKRRTGIGGERIQASAFIVATLTGDEAIAEFLWRYSKNPDRLGWVIIGGHAGLVKKIFAEGYRLVPGRSPFSTAIMNHDTDMVKTLLEHVPSGRKLCLEDLDGRNCTALQLAIRLRQQDILMLLLENGADPNFNGPSGFTILMDAVLNGDSKVTQTLVESGAHVDSQDLQGRTVLSWAASGGNRHTIDYLASCKYLDRSQYGVPDIMGRTPLIHAILGKNFGATKRLLELGASPNVEDESRTTPLAHAASLGIPAFVALLLELGANPNHGSSRFALKRAIVAGCLRSVQLLVLHRNASPSCYAISSSQRKWSEFARDNHKREIADFLEERGL